MAVSASHLAGGDEALTARIQASRKLLHRRALVAAAASTVPVPGLDWAVDAALLAKLLPEINRAFGLAPEQIEALPAHQRETVQRATTAIGSMLVGKFVTRDLVLRAAKVVGVRLTTQQAAKYVPLAGSAVAAALGYTAIRYLGEKHIQDCVQVARSAGLRLPAPSPTLLRLVRPEAG